jgi:hypothetical protein
MQEPVRSDEDEENRGGSKIVGFFLRIEEAVKSLDSSCHHGQSIQ